MECPKCHHEIPANQTVCPKCHKVVLLKCPNCASLSETSVCSKCGYNILVKCSKCSKINPITKKNCLKCGFSLTSSLALQECESDEFAAIIIKFNGLKNIRSLLKTRDLYEKFLYKLKNLLLAQIKKTESKLIIYDDIFVINMNKELSFATSSDKATRLALKIINSFAELNSNVIQEIGTPLNLTLSIIKKDASELLDLITFENEVKLLTSRKDSKAYLKGFQLILDQYVRDQINKNYKTDSLFSIENNGKSLMLYEVILDSYILPPEKKSEDKQIDIKPTTLKQTDNTSEKDLYSFKVFDINAKCSFERTSYLGVLDNLASIDLNNKGKIISIRTSSNLEVSSADLTEIFINRSYKVLNITCTPEMNYQPWGFFKAVFQEFFGLSFHRAFNNVEQIPANSLKLFKPLFEFLSSKALKAMTPEDARFAYMEQWSNLLSIMSNTVIIVDGFENLDDTAIQTLELYFDKFKNIKPNFVFITPNNLPVHSKIKGLLRTPIYTEYTLQKTSIDLCLATLKADATNFIESFYFDKIKENFKGSYLYFKNAIQYLKETDIIMDFEGKLILKTKKSVILPKNIKELYKARMKHLGKSPEQSFIMAYMAILGQRLDKTTLSKLGIKDLDKNCENLIKNGLIFKNEDIFYIDNFNTVSDVVNSALKKEANEFLSKNLLAQLGKGLDDTTTALIMGRLSAFKEEYLTLWKNAQFAIKTGDYDAYLKNCLGFLSLVEHIESNISKEEIEENKKDVYNNILACLYSYSPAKIYFIENILLMDAIKEGDDDKIVKLSNLMLQGALISSNYTDAMGLLHNILSRMKNATLIVDGELNTKFLLLSLVSIEIFYNIGNYRQCVDTMNEILAVLNPENINSVKPASFSVNLFVSHVMETCRLAAMAKLYLLDEDQEDFFTAIKTSLKTELPEKDAIIAIKKFLAEKSYSSGNIEEYSAYSKVIFLIIQEISSLKDDYKRFAQNIYQAKLLSADIHQQELEMFCDLLIAYAYAKNGVTEKAESIYNDVLENAEKSAMYNIINIAKYLLADLKRTSDSQKALLLINDSLAIIRKYSNQSKILFALFEKLYINIATEQNLTSVDIETEEQKILPLQEQLSLILG